VRWHILEQRSGKPRARPDRPDVAELVAERAERQQQAAGRGQFVKDDPGGPGTAAWNVRWITGSAAAIALASKDVSNVPSATPRSTHLSSLDSPRALTTATKPTWSRGPVAPKFPPLKRLHRSRLVL